MQLSTPLTITLLSSILLFSLIKFESIKTSSQKFNTYVKNLHSNNIDFLRLSKIDKTCKKMKVENEYYRNYIESSSKMIEVFKNFTVNDERSQKGNKNYGRFQEWYYDLDPGKSSKNKNERNKRTKPTYLMCTPPKSGTTNWQKLLISIKKNVTSESINHEYSKEGNKLFFNILDKVKDKLWDFWEIVEDRNRVKVLNVRHPVERLYSAWGQKFNVNHWNNGKYVEEFVIFWGGIKKT